MSTGKKIIIGLICVLFLLTAGAYGVGVCYFTNHFLPGSVVNGFNCSYMSEEETEELLSKQTEAYVLTLYTRNGGIESLTAEQLGLTYISDGTVKKLMREQKRFLWFLSFQQSEEYQMTVHNRCEEQTLSESIYNLDCMQLSNMTLTSDAFIKESEEGYLIVPEVQGNELNYERVYENIVNAAVSGMTALDLEESGCYEEPKVYQDDERLISNCEFMNAVTDVIITYDFADRTETVDKEVIKDWITWDKDGYCTLDKEAMSLFVSNLAYQYNTVGTVRTFNTYDNRTVTIEGGDYGWIIDEQAETDALAAAIFSGETQVKEPVYTNSGWCRDSNDIGYSYLEVDLTNQRMVLYLDGKPIVDTRIVSGNPNFAGAETPTGCFSVKAMQSPAEVNCDGFLTNVNYLLNFAGNLSVHDASWRTEFGNNLYLLEGTYGCIHVPYENMAAIYANAGINFPVVIYK